SRMSASRSAREASSLSVLITIILRSDDVDRGAERVSGPNRSLEVQPRARARSPRRARKRQPSSAPYQRLLQPTSPPRGEATLGFPIGVVPKLPFPRGWYTVQRCGNPRRVCISGLYQAFGPAGPVPAMAWYRRMVQLGHFLLLRRLWLDTGNFLPPMLG